MKLTDEDLKSFKDKLLNDPVSINTFHLPKWKKAMGEFDKGKWQENHTEHCELYLKHQPQEEKDFYIESIRLHHEYDNISNDKTLEEKELKELYNEKT